MRPKAMFCFIFSVLLSPFLLTEGRAFPPPSLKNNASQQGELLAGRLTPGGPDLGNLPDCVHRLTDVKILERDRGSYVLLTEIFKNNYKEKFCAFYALPLPEDAVVESARISCGESLAWSDFYRYRASDLNSSRYIDESQEVTEWLNRPRPNKFLQFIQDVPPGEEICITISYSVGAAKSDEVAQTTVLPAGGEEDFCEEGILRGCDYRMALIYLALMLLGLYAVSVFFERVMLYGAAINQSRYFSARVQPFLQPDQLPEARKISGSYPKSPLANIMSAVFSTVEESPRQLSPLPELCGSARRRATLISEAGLRRGLSGLKSSAWLALLIGALGTVINLLDVFQFAMVEERVGLSAVAGSIAESFTIALFGLLIFLPALWAGKLLSAKAAKIGLETDRASWELVDSLLKRRSEARLLDHLQTPIWSDC